MASDLPDKDAHRLDAQLLSDLWVFRAAARLESITAASRRLGVTQGAVSQRVLRLEARLGTPLFVRVRSRILLTEAGEVLIKAMTDVAEILNGSLSKIYNDQRGLLVVSCVPSLATEWLVPALHDFYETHPGIEVFVRSEMITSTAERLDEDGVDIAIDYSGGTHDGLHELESVPEKIFPVCSRDYLRKMTETDPDDNVVMLHDNVPWTGRDDPDAEWREWRQTVGEDWPNVPRTDRRFNLAVLAYRAALSDQGIAMGRSVVVQRLLAKGELVPASKFPPVSGFMYRAVTHRPGNVNSPVRRFARWWAVQMRATQAKTLALLESGYALKTGDED